MKDESPEDKIKQLIRESVPASTKVVDFAAAARKRGISFPQLTPTTMQTLHISGSNNVGVAGDHNSVSINVRGTPRKALQVNVQPGEKHITDEQAVEVRDLVAKVVETSGKDYGFVWGVTKKRFRFTKYQLLDLEKYDAVRAYLRNWICSSGASGTRPSTMNRNSALARIHVESKKVVELPEKIHHYIQTRFDVGSLADLTLAQLTDVINEFRL